MAKNDREFKDVYWVRALERFDTGVRKEVERYVCESSSGALHKYEELCIKYSKEPYIVDILFIHEGQFHTIKEKRMVDKQE